MLRFIFFILFILSLYYALRLIFSDTISRKKMNRGTEPEELVQDPYCQTYIPKSSAVKKKIAGRMLYFCNRECLKNYFRKKS